MPGEQLRQRAADASAMNPTFWLLILRQ